MGYTTVGACPLRFCVFATDHPTGMTFLLGLWHAWTSYRAPRVCRVLCLNCGGCLVSRLLWGDEPRVLCYRILCCQPTMVSWYVLLFSPIPGRRVNIRFSSSVDSTLCLCGQVGSRMSAVRRKLSRIVRKHPTYLNRARSSRSSLVM